MDIQQSAFVLHSRPYKETSALVTFFTQEQGKVTGVVRGVRGGRKSTSQKSAAIQPFQKLLIQWREKPQQSNDLVSIREFEALPVVFPLQSDANICGLYLNELLYRLLFPRVATASLFNDYQQALYGLLNVSSNRSNQAWTLRQFETRLLDEMGQPVMLRFDIEGQAVRENQMYRYYLQKGLVAEQGNMLSSDETPNRFNAHDLQMTDSEGFFNDQHYSSGQVLRVSGQSLLALAEDNYCEACLPELKTLFRYLLADVLGNKPIKTRELFR